VYCPQIVGSTLIDGQAPKENFVAKKTPVEFAVCRRPAPPGAAANIHVDQRTAPYWTLCNCGAAHVQSLPCLGLNLKS